jgi:flagellar biosynthetic protein FliR
MEILSDTIMTWLASFLWPLFRIAAMVAVMAGIGTQNVSMRIKLLLSLAITFAVAPMLPPPPAIELFSIAAVLVTLQQVLIGIAIGFISVMVMQTFVVAGQIIGMQTSLGFASLVDPSNGQSVPVVGQFYLLLATMIYFAINGHLLMIQMVVSSFQTVPVGMEGLASVRFNEIVTWGSWMFAAAVTMALSATVALLLINFSFGVLTRAAPQLNIFTIGFPITMLSGLLILWLTIGNFLNHFENQWQRGVQLMCQVLGGPC